MQIKNFTTMIPTGVSFVASQTVGNCIGMNQVERARNYSRVSINYSMIVTALMTLIFFIFSHPVSFALTDDPEVAKCVRDCFWSLFLYIFFSTVKGVQNGTARALEFQKQNSILTLLFAYGVGIPMAAVFAFMFKMGLAGIWFGIAIANALLVGAIHIYLSTADWQSIAEYKSQKTEKAI